MMPILVKVMTSEVEERPGLVTASYGWHRSQWVNNNLLYIYITKTYTPKLEKENPPIKHEQSIYDTKSE